MLALVRIIVVRANVKSNYVLILMILKVFEVRHWKEEDEACHSQQVSGEKSIHSPTLGIAGQAIHIIEHCIHGNQVGVRSK